MILVHATVPVDPDSHDAAVDAIEDVVAASREEDGVLEYRAFTEVGDDDTFHFLERYEDDAAFASHAQSDHFMQFAGALPEFVAGEPELVRFEVDGMSEIGL